MKKYTTFPGLFSVICLLCFGGCAASQSPGGLRLSGSTPGDSFAKAILAIPATDSVDFIRWELTLRDDSSFSLSVVHGLSRPNTLGFQPGAKSLMMEGRYSISRVGVFSQVYHLNSGSLPAEIRLARLDNRVFHLLTPDQTLMVGNGGWSYSLFGKEQDGSGEWRFTPAWQDDTVLQAVFHGRTPCQEIAADHKEMNAGESCFKLKWRLVLNRDSLTRQPGTCSIRKVVNNEALDVAGTWRIIKGLPSYPEAIVYEVTTDPAAAPILFLAGDGGVLFFLSPGHELYPGSQDFGVVLNRKG